MHRTDKQSDRRRTSTNSIGTSAFALVLRKKNPAIWSSAGISTSLRKTLMSMIRSSGAEPSWLRRANFIAGGIIRCAPLKKIAAYASTQFWRARQWRRTAADQESILKCAKVRNHPITRQCGRNFRIKKTPNDQLGFSELNVGHWALNVGR